MIDMHKWNENLLTIIASIPNFMVIIFFLLGVIGIQLSKILFYLSIMWQCTKLSNSWFELLLSRISWAETFKPIKRNVETPIPFSSLLYFHYNNIKWLYQEKRKIANVKRVGQSATSWSNPTRVGSCIESQNNQRFFSLLFYF